MLSMSKMEIPESVLKMVAGFLGLDREKAAQFVEDFHKMAVTTLQNQDEILMRLRAMHDILQKLSADHFQQNIPARNGALTREENTNA